MARALSVVIRHFMHHRAWIGKYCKSTTGQTEVCRVNSLVPVFSFTFFFPFTDALHFSFLLISYKLNSTEKNTENREVEGQRNKCGISCKNREADTMFVEPGGFLD